MQEESIEKVQYTSYDNLTNPTSESISQGAISLGFASKEWYIQFQTITNLRQANKYYSNVFFNQLLPSNYKSILGQVQNLRSNNSKEALTLLSEFIQFHELVNVNENIVRPIVAALIIKSNSQKGFIKAQALKGLNSLTLKWSQAALQELCVHTQSANGQISQLAIKLIGEMLENTKNIDVNDKFLKSLSSNLNGKRAFVQKKAREILNLLKVRVGSQQLQQKINISTQLLQQQSNTLKKQLKYKEQQKPKGPSLKQFLKNKKTS